jgi:hypothetical protein
VNQVNVAMTIEGFHTLLTAESEREGSPLLEALHKLTMIQDPADIAALAEEDGPVWTDWRSV